MLKIDFMSFTQLNDDLIELIRQKRNAYSVRMHMLHNHTISKDEHAQFIQGLQQSSNRLYTLVMVNGEPFAVLRAIAQDANWQVIRDIGFYRVDDGKNKKVRTKDIYYLFLQYLHKHKGVLESHSLSKLDNKAGVAAAISYTRSIEGDVSFDSNYCYYSVKLQGKSLNCLNSLCENFHKIHQAQVEFRL